MADESPVAGTPTERTFFVVFVLLFAWSLHSRFVDPDPLPDATSFTALTAAMVLMGAAPLVRSVRLRYVVSALSAIALIAFFLLR